jgi:hypothetical protein
VEEVAPGEWRVVHVCWHREHITLDPPKTGVKANRTPSVAGGSRMSRILLPVVCDAARLCIETQAKYHSGPEMV